VQDVRSDDPLVAFSREHHDHESAGAYVLDVIREVLELLQLERADHRPLDLREESMFFAGEIQTMNRFLAVQDVDVLAAKSGGEQGFYGFVRRSAVGECADYTIRGVSDELGSAGAHDFHGCPVLPNRRRGPFYAATLPLSSPPGLRGAQPPTRRSRKRNAEPASSKPYGEGGLDRRAKQ
jgi:hypothetical protein